MPDGHHKDWARARNPSGDVKITESHPIIKKIVMFLSTHNMSI
jgi:hypothetical protein